MTDPNAQGAKTFRWIPIVELDWAAVASAFNLCYCGYLVPLTMTGEDIRLRVSAESIDRDGSYVVFQLAAPVGLAFVARRGTASRLAAFGVAPATRRSGLGRVMLERVINEAVGRGDFTMELEVIDSNAVAANLYQAHGFRTIDSLLGFELATRPPSVGLPLREEGIERIAADIAQDVPNPLPWQLAGESLKQLGSGWTVVSVDDGARAIVNLSRDDALLLRLLHTPSHMRSRGSARRLIEALRMEAGGRPIRVPQLIPARYERFAHRMGFTTTTLRQRRMLLDFKSRSALGHLRNTSGAIRPPGYF